MTAVPPELQDLTLRERHRRRLEDPALRGALASTSTARRCSECGVLIRGRSGAFTCGQDCADERRKRRNRERAEAWRTRAKQAIAGRLDVFGPSGPPPVAYLDILAGVPAGATLTLQLPNGSSVSWARR